MLQPSDKAQAVDEHALHEILAGLPALPSVIRYYDEFNDVVRSIRNPAASTTFEVYVTGRLARIHFETIPGHLTMLMKHVFVYLIEEDLAPGTVFDYVYNGKSFDTKTVNVLLAARPAGITAAWSNVLNLDLQFPAYLFAKSLLKLLCKYRLGGWSNSYGDVLSALPLPSRDKYAAVRSGEAFLSVDEEAKLVRFFDETASRCEAHLGVREGLEDVAMLLCAYQFGMRPLQIAMLKWRDIRIRHGRAPYPPTVHLTFRMVKQRSTSTFKPLLRRVKSEWCPIFVSLQRSARERNLDQAERAMGVQSSYEATFRIASLMRGIIGGNASATNLRHTAAQRLVDAGASQEELAEFLGHADVTSGLVYYETSANQAERVNKALGISEVYQNVAKIAHARFIGAEELARLKGAHQIGGAPHGFAIAGIGGCTSGQPACPYNPIMSCYGCRKFMPLYDREIHLKVLSEFRRVARFFHDVSRSDSASPAYLQLQRTISEVQSVVNELESESP